MKSNQEQKLLHEFSEFVDAAPVTPSKEVDEKVTNLVANDLLPSPMKAIGRVALIETFSGLLTLTICPQFGLGIGRHNDYLHSLHTMTTPATFYLFCGVFFVLLGAGLSGLILNRAELRTVGNLRLVYFAVYSIFAYLTLVVLGPEKFVLSSLVWILGAFLGNVMGFEAIIRLRRAET